MKPNFTAVRVAVALALAMTSSAFNVTAGTPSSTRAAAPDLVSLHSLQVDRYMGRWYQVGLYPNRFQKQCVSDTTATYRLRDDGKLDVLNRCRDSAGQWDQATGIARPVGRVQDGWLSPAQLRVSFLPAWLRWLPLGWGNYWVVKLADDHRYAVISEPGREYLWILSRTPQLSTDDEVQIRTFLVTEGFELARLQSHRHSTP